MIYRSLLAAALLPLLACAVQAQDDEQLRSEQILSVNMTGGEASHGVDVFSRRAPDDSSIYAGAWLRLGDRELWHLPEDFTTFKLDYTIGQADYSVNRQVIVITAHTDNDYTKNWLLAWDGKDYINFEMPNNGLPDWNGDNTYSSREHLGFASITRQWKLDLESHSATPLDNTAYPFIGGAMAYDAAKPLTLWSEQGGGDEITVKRGEQISIEAIDLKGAHESSESDVTVMWGDAWLRVRTSKGVTGWARLNDVNTAINGLPWAG